MAGKNIAKMNDKKSSEYAQKVYLQLSELFNEDCENYIDPNELLEDDNATNFIHAIGTLAPALIYGQLQKENTDMLSFNHILNRLIYQAKEDNS